MLTNKTVLAICCAVLLGIGGCSRQQSDWQKTREANSTDAYEQFLKKYPSGEFSAQAQGRLKEMYEERDWQKARDADTPEAYQAFLKQYPEGKSDRGGPNPGGEFHPGADPRPARRAGHRRGRRRADTPARPGRRGVRGTPAAGQGAGRAAAPSRGARRRRRCPDALSLPASAARGESGKYAVQLGAFRSGQAAANKRWDTFRRNIRNCSGVCPRKSSRRRTAAAPFTGCRRSASASPTHARSARSQGQVPALRRRAPDGADLGRRSPPPQSPDLAEGGPLT